MAMRKRKETSVRASLELEGIKCDDFSNLGATIARIAALSYAVS